MKERKEGEIERKRGIKQRGKKKKEKHNLKMKINESEEERKGERK